MGPTRRQVVRGGPVALSAGRVAPSAPDAFEGLYPWGFEESVFAPCGRDEGWWVVDDAELVERYRDVATDEYERVYAPVEGRLSHSGSYGHLGAYPRQLAVDRVLELRRSSEGDC